ncbi:hypothetical protein [Haloferula sp. A504]|uniref:hypothetical protein n=1 Tax=Haloferula sp. A504 TaxID=3373601 RepID=UPI0031C9D909|nr:hypothetical protein [Verrucomicrobiaceae bacterium E54]
MKRRRWPAMFVLMGVVTSFQEQIEWHLLISSLVVGLAVGVMSLVGLWRKLRG